MILPGATGRVCEETPFVLPTQGLTTSVVSLCPQEERAAPSEGAYKKVWPWPCTSLQSKPLVLGSRLHHPKGRHCKWCQRILAWVFKWLHFNYTRTTFVFLFHGHSCDQVSLAWMFTESEPQSHMSKYWQTRNYKYYTHDEYSLQKCLRILRVRAQKQYCYGNKC